MNDAARKRLWEDYARLKTSELREKLILEYAPLVKVVAGRLSMYLGYNVEYEDLVSYGVFGLIDAIDWNMRIWSATGFSVLLMPLTSLTRIKK